MDIDKDEEDLHPSELSRCCVARVKVVEKGRHTDFICTECDQLCDRYSKCGGTADPWPPDTLLAALGITRGEWDNMESSSLPRALAIEVMFKKAVRRLQG